jgi:ribosomal protein L31
MKPSDHLARGDIVFGNATRGVSREFRSSFRKQLLADIEKLRKRIDDLDRKIIIARGRCTACGVCSSSHPKHTGDPEISEMAHWELTAPRKIIPER